MKVMWVSLGASRHLARSAIWGDGMALWVFVRKAAETMGDMDIYVFLITKLNCLKRLEIPVFASFFRFQNWKSKRIDSEIAFVF